MYNKQFMLLCCITFLALCNTAVYFNLHPYLMELGITARHAGFLIGLYSLASMFFYAFGSKWITSSNSYGCMCLGLLILCVCGNSYMLVRESWLIGLIRMGSGFGLFLAMASTMVVLVQLIPPHMTGIGFSVFSVAMLLPYSIMPAVTELASPCIEQPPQLYSLTALLLLPAAGFALFRSRQQRAADGQKKSSTETTHLKKLREKNIRRPTIRGLLWLNGSYFTVFSSQFYLLKGFATHYGIHHPGYFFTIQMGVMIALRLTGSGLFDTVNKACLVQIALFCMAAGFGMLPWATSSLYFFMLAILFGIGMGLCVPPLNALMYQHSVPELRGYNANMMMLAMHFSSFIGPYIGTWLIVGGGYNLYCFAAVCLMLTGIFVVQRLYKKQSNSSR